ncbi:MAG: ATP-dependent RNA helicase, partial [Candidatus Magasanikbacteria bacterium]|nr:ATP-dependent RNA helicase [Candidatus Magasanikbacteria bacterium]
MRDHIKREYPDRLREDEILSGIFEKLRLDRQGADIAKYTLRAIERAKAKGLGSVEFPIDNYEAKFDEIFAGSEAILVEAGTGAGKSLTLGVWTLGALEGKVQRGENTLRQRPRVAMTQPRKDAAQGVCIGTSARFEEMDFGKDITFATSEFKGLHDDIPLQIQTTKMLVNRFRHDPMLLHYDAVVVDEAHERSIDSDVLLGLLKRANRLRAQKNQPLLKIVVASATIDIEKFQNFLEIGQQQTLSVEGRMFPVEEHFLTSQEKIEIDPYTRQEREVPYTTLAAKKVIEILTTTSKGDILVFIPGSGEINSTIDQIRTLMSEAALSSVEVLPLHGGLRQDEREMVVLGGDRGKRRVIVSTNIAETSLTVPNIEHVVDAARQKETYYDPAVGLTGLAERPASKAACNQRKGRAGRVKPGDYHSLLTKEEFDALPEFSKPEIQRGELAKTCLELLESGITDLERFDFIDPPEPERLKGALDLLTILGAIDEKRKVTERGRRMAEIPFDARMSAVVHEAEKRGCVRETLGAYYFLQEQFVFEKILKYSDGTYAPGARELEEKIRAFAQTCTGDWDRARKLFFGFVEAKNQRVFCINHGLQYTSMVRIANKYADGWRSAKREGVRIEETLHEGDFRQCLLAGLAPDQLVTNVGRRYNNQFTALYSGEDVGIARGTVLSLTGNYPSLAVAATVQGGKRGTQKSDGSQNFSRFYAAGVQPVSTKDVRNAVPHRVRQNPSEPAQFSVSPDGKVVVTNRYEFLNKTGGWVGLPAEKEFAPSGVGARRALAEYVRTQARYSYGETADKFKEQFHLEPNAFAQEIRTIDALYQRSRGVFAWAGYDQWFEDQFGDCTTLSQVQPLSSERFVLSVNSVCPQEKQEAIQKASPDSLRIGDTAVAVQYA